MMPFGAPRRSSLKSREPATPNRKLFRARAVYLFLSSRIPWLSSIQSLPSMRPSPPLFAVLVIVVAVALPALAFGCRLAEQWAAGREPGIGKALE